MLYHFLITGKDHTVARYGVMRASHKDRVLAHAREEIDELDWPGEYVVTISKVTGVEKEWENEPASLSLVLKVLIDSSAGTEHRIAG